MTSEPTVAGQAVRWFERLGRGDIEAAGGKGANLGELTKAGVPVPPGFVLTTAAYRAFVAETGIGERIIALATLGPDLAPEAYEAASTRIRELFGSAEVPGRLARELHAAAAELGEVPLAVRSSATAEDLADASFAGQQDTYLGVRGPDRLLEAVRNCWASLWTARAMAYRARRGIAPSEVALAVVVQKMVDADAAGVLFTANPTNGRRDETVISAAWGLGESVVSGAVTTDDIVVAGGRVRSHDVADKAVMTVDTGAGTREEPVPADRRSRPVLDDDGAVALARLGTRIAEHFGSPQDVEWARSGDAFWIVQARPITALPEPHTDPPTDWTVPDPKRAYYMRASIVEQLPEPLSPLFADLVDGSVTRSLKALFNEFIGRDVIGDDDIGLPTVNGYAYYRYSRAGMGRIMLRSGGVFRMVTRTGPGSAEWRWRNYSHPRYVDAIGRWAQRDLAGMPTADLMTGVGELLDAGTEYYTSVQTIIPVAVTAETTFSKYYDTVVRRTGDPQAATFLLGFDSTPIRAEKSLYELGTWAAGNADLAAALRAGGDMFAAQRSDVDPAVWREWTTRFRAHLDRYGHMIYNLDFMHPVPADDPAPLLETLRFYLDGTDADPHERQRRAADRREEATTAVLARLDPVRAAGFRKLLRWAQASAPLREDALGDIGLAWPLLRAMAREIGERFVALGRIDRVDDVFWLRRDEVLADGERSALRDVVDDRKALWRGQSLATPPQMLPKGTWWEMFDSMMPAASTEQTGAVIRGIGASVGQVTAPARVLRGPEDFGRMRPGDVLVAGITTPAWTPLFPLASAVVTDVGGPLSHSSIVAREYGIPAVLGTGVATRRITDGERVQVDGGAGTVTLLDQADDAQEEAAATPVHAPLGARAALPVAAGAIAAGLWLLRRARRRSA